MNTDTRSNQITHSSRTTSLLRYETVRHISEETPSRTRYKKETLGISTELGGAIIKLTSSLLPTVNKTLKNVAKLTLTKQLTFCSLNEAVRQVGHVIIRGNCLQNMNANSENT